MGFGAENADIDNDELWDDHDEYLSEVQDILDSQNMVRLPCFAHTLQLAIGDGLKVCNSINGALGKCSKLASILHTSSTFKDCFDIEFPNRSIPQVGNTRWNSLLTHVKAIMSFNSIKLDRVIMQANRPELLLKVPEREQLQQLIKVLDPFLEATLVTQGEKVV